MAVSDWSRCIRTRQTQPGEDADTETCYHNNWILSLVHDVMYSNWCTLYPRTDWHVVKGSVRMLPQARQNDTSLTTELENQCLQYHVAQSCTLGFRDKTLCAFTTAVFPSIPLSYSTSQATMLGGYATEGTVARFMHLLIGGRCCHLVYAAMLC